MKELSTHRSKLLLKNIVASFILKGWSALVVLVMVPLTLKMLGIYQNGVWLTLSSILLWINFMDIGLGNGLRNSVAHYVASDETEKVREAVASTFAMLVVIVIPLIVFVALFLSFIDVDALLGVETGLVRQLDLIVFVAVVLTASSFILKAVGNFYMGLQLPAMNNLIICLGQTFSLLFTFLAYWAGSRSLMMVVVINTATPLLVWALSIPYTFHYKYPQYCPTLKHVNWAMSMSLCNVGLQFFVIQICAVVLFMSTNVIISRMFSPADVTPYQVAYRYFNITFVAFSTICMPFWNATTDAYTRGDIEWIHRSSKKLDLLTLAAFVALVGMVLVSDTVYAFWVGREVVVPKELSVSVATYIFVLIFSQRYSFILNGLNVLLIQIVFTGIAAVLFLPLAWLACHTFGTVTSLVWTMCLVNTPGLFANMWKYYQVIYKKQKK